MLSGVVDLLILKRKDEKYLRLLNYLFVLFYLIRKIKLFEYCLFYLNMKW